MCLGSRQIVGSDGVCVECPEFQESDGRSCYYPVISDTNDDSTTVDDSTTDENTATPVDNNTTPVDNTTTPVDNTTTTNETAT
tara:strand:+ start:496 stop:744 length:249 start_codon:yes stop_codon:yes gene_type:complete